MTRLDEKAALARDIEMLRTLIDRLLDEGRLHEDPMLAAATFVLNGKLAEFRRDQVSGPWMDR